MVNKIIDGMCEALKGMFPTGYDIYTEMIEQNLQEPCFFVKCINPGTNLFLGKRYLSTNQFIIQYFPSTDEPNKECNEVIGKLNDCMEWITVDGNLTMVSDTQSNIVDNILTYTLNYDFFVDKVPETPVDDMETFTTTVNAKE